ncbi:MAG: DUF378 domain-containing protein [Pseudomonadota bacterium]
MKALNMITWLLLIIGGLNWGIVALAPEYNLVDMIFGAGSQLAKIVYILVGVAAVWSLIVFAKCCKGGCGDGTCCTK